MARLWVAWGCAVSETTRDAALSRETMERWLYDAPFHAAVRMLAEVVTTTSAPSPNAPDWSAATKNTTDRLLRLLDQPEGPAALLSLFSRQELLNHLGAQESVCRFCMGTGDLRPFDQGEPIACDKCDGAGSVYVLGVEE